MTLRGFGISPAVGLPQGLSVFVDGVRVNEPDASQVNFNLIPLHDIERVEVIRGPSGPFGKNALGGAINLRTRRGSQGFSGGAELAAGSLGQVEGTGYVGGGRGGFDYHLSTRYLQIGGWREHAFTRLRHLFAKVGWQNASTDLWLSYTTASDSILQAGSLPLSWLENPEVIPARFRGEHGDPRRINFTEGDFFGPRLHFLTARATRQLGGPIALETNAF